jgi:nucleotide-binding universal stress UspA family protein
MGIYRKLLVGFDGSPSSANALGQAIGLARTERSWIKVISVAPSNNGDLDLTGVKNLREAFRGPAERALAQAARIASDERASVMTALEEGEPHERIVAVAESENCNLIIMGRHGKNRIEKALLGSVTSRVIGHTTKDVMVVPHDAAIDWRNILLCTDGSGYSEAAARHAMEFAKAYGGRLNTVSVVDITDELFAEAPGLFDKLIEKHKGILERVKKEAERAGVDAEFRLKEGEPAQKILEEASEQKAGVIFMGSHGRTGLLRLLMGSTTEKVVGYAPCPVIVVKPG